jgi:hypothetical protein
VSLAAFLGCLRVLQEGLGRDLIRRVAEDEGRIMRLACDAVDDDGSLGLAVNLSSEDLALWIGAKRRSVNTALQDWRSREVIALFLDQNAGQSLTGTGNIRHPLFACGEPPTPLGWPVSWLAGQRVTCSGSVARVRVMGKGTYS